tara:strand:- start:126 stop:818 length:693 start_codon:yes stop_codon:yes gene_type:complete
MKKLLFILAAAALLGGLSLRVYFALVPPPEPTLDDLLSDIVPEELNGWKIIDQDMAESPESSERISDFLNFDDALFRIFKKGDTFVGLYIAYWLPGKASYRWAGAHTPDTCWVQNGWTRLDRKYCIPFQNEETPFQPAEFGIYEKDGSTQNVYFWHLVGGEAFGYEQEGGHNIFAALLDIKKYGLNLRNEQFFIRLSSNKKIEELKKVEGFNQILDSLNEIGLAKTSHGN